MLPEPNVPPLITVVCPPNTGNVAMQESTKTTLWAGLLVSAWHIGLVIGATASSAAVPAKLTLEEKLSKQYQKK